MHAAPGGPRDAGPSFIVRGRSRMRRDVIPTTHPVLLLIVAAHLHVHVVAAATPRQSKTHASGDDFAVVAYLPEWRYEGANWDTICQHVSHLIIFSLEVAPSGAL